MNIWKYANPMPWRYLSNWRRNFKSFFRCIKWSKQRIVRGYADIDVWNFDNYLYNIIIGGLNHLADHHTSIPVFFEKTIDQNQDGWTNRLHETAELFEESKRLLDDQFCDLESMEQKYQRAVEFRRRGFDRLHEYWGDLWD